MTNTRKAKLIEGLLMAWHKADQEYEDLRIQADPLLLQIYGEEKKDIPNLNTRTKDALIRSQTIMDELCELSGAQPFKYPKNILLPDVSLPQRPEPIPTRTEKNTLLRQRVEKGREYLKREYWVAYQGKGRRDDQIDGHAKEWTNLTMRLFEEEKHG